MLYQLSYAGSWIINRRCELTLKVLNFVFDICGCGAKNPFGNANSERQRKCFASITTLKLCPDCAKFLFLFVLWFFSLSLGVNTPLPVPRRCVRTALTRPSRTVRRRVNAPAPWSPASLSCCAPPGSGPVSQGCQSPETVTPIKD